MSARIPQSNFVQGGYYHVFNRGNRKQDVFLDDKDFKRYLDRLKDYKDHHNISVLAYCLMPNHIHFLIRQNGPEPISNFFQRLHTAYTMYFNKRYGQTGHLFESRFKAKPVDRDEYLLHLSRYIHLNPKGLVSRLPSYKFSSYKSYIEEFDDEISEPNFILNFFKSKHTTKEDAKRKYKEFTQDQEDYYYKIKDVTFNH